jgi:acyl-CoA reductase-like NAD-dependent aldehyde dehydrogenase
MSHTPSTMASGRMAIEKTVKQYVGGKFIRSESGRVMRTEGPDGRPVFVPHGSKKDLRDAVRVAREAQGKWAAATAYNRGQILYRLAEMLDDRRFPIADADHTAAVARAVHHAGWTDKVTAVLSTLNPVSGTYVNYSRIRPLGVVVAAPAREDGLLGLVEASCASAVMGNGTIVVVDSSLGEVAAAFAEALHTSDLPGGVINVLLGDADELLAAASLHDDIDGLLLYGARPTIAALQKEGAQVMRRIIQVPSAAVPAGPIELQRLAEVQTVWMSAYEPQGGASAY